MCLDILKKEKNKKCTYFIRLQTFTSYFLSYSLRSSIHKRSIHNHLFSFNFKLYCLFFEFFTFFKNKNNCHLSNS